jgi:hypothetical protein
MQMTGFNRRAKALEPCSIDDIVLATRTRQAIYRIVSRLNKDDYPQRWTCNICHTDILHMPLESYDHDQGPCHPGFTRPQWFYLHDEHYDLAIWKLAIRYDDIIKEMQDNGDVPLNYEPVFPKE